MKITNVITHLLTSRWTDVPAFFHALHSTAMMEYFKPVHQLPGGVVLNRITICASGCLSFWPVEDLVMLG